MEFIGNVVALRSEIRDFRAPRQGMLRELNRIDQTSKIKCRLDRIGPTIRHDRAAHKEICGEN